jgi:putative membrane protein
MWHTGEGMGWWMVFGGALWLLFWAVVVYVVVQFSRGRFSEGPATDRPIDIARRRYAAGEITKAQYEELRRDLSERAA